MIDVLRIQNLALIDDLELECGPGLNVLTGETGAGKSFIISAVNFLTGEKMSPDLVRADCEKAVVEALFELDGRDVILRRELTAENGRSRIYLDGQLASRDALAALRPKLLLHASQHGQQRLLQPAFQVALLDGFLEDSGPLAAKHRLLRELTAVSQSRRELEAKVASLEERRQYLEFQHNEIGRVGPKPGEEDDLITRRASLAASRKASEALNRALDSIEGAPRLLEGLAELHRELLHAGECFAEFVADAEVVANFRHQLKDVATRLRRRPAPDVEDDAEVIEKRLFELAQLKRKLKRGLDEIVHLNAEIEANLAFLDDCGLERKRLVREEARLVAELTAILDSLGQSRHEAACRLSADLEQTLAGLGFSKDVKVLFDFVPVEVYTPTAAELAPLVEERARILWCPNPGQPPQPLDKIASGGELSRFLLALMSLSAEAGGPTLIFDEIDAGIGGLTLTSVGAHIRALADTTQILLITHWPQLASLADRHFQVAKTVEEGRTSTHCQRLTGPAVAEELSRMAGGGEAGSDLARHLLEGKAGESPVATARPGNLLDSNR